MTSPDNLKLLHALPEGEHPVSMLVHKDTLYVATNLRVYRIGDDGKLYLVPIAPLDDA